MPSIIPPRDPGGSTPVDPGAVHSVLGGAERRAITFGASGFPEFPHSPLLGKRGETDFFPWNKIILSNTQILN